MTWTDERIEFVREKAASFTASEIAELIYRHFRISASRNSVIGICLRRGIKLAARQSPAAVASPPRAKPERNVLPFERSVRVSKITGQPAFKPPPLVEAKSTAEFLPAGKGKTLLALGRNDCRWPHGDPQDARFRFCAEPVDEDGAPYCAGHRSLAVMLIRFEHTASRG